MAEKLPYVPPYAHIIFCEDVRQEKNGQATLVGVFRSHILNIASPPPILFAQIVAAIQIIVPKEVPFDSIQVRMKLEDKVIQEVTLSEELRAGLRSSDRDDPEATRHYLSLEMKAVPLHVAATGLLLVEVLLNGKHLNHSALRFRFQEASVGATQPLPPQPA
jgi:hypothetical protein